MNQLIEPEVATHFSPGIYIREMRLVHPGVVITTHVHDQDHFSILGSGVVEVEIDGASRSVEGPSVILIKAGQAHRIVAHTPVVWFCIWPVPDEVNQGSVETYINTRIKE